jgi:hypothetical protein
VEWTIEKTQDAAQIAWPVERPFYPEKASQPDASSNEVRQGIEEEPDN